MIVPLIRSLRVSGAVVVAFSFLTLMTDARADTLRFPDGHTYSEARFQDFTAEGVVSTGEQQLRQGARLTLPRLNGGVVLFADVTSSAGEESGVAVVTDVEYSGNGDGVGVYFDPEFNWNGLNIILRLSRNDEDVEVDDRLTVSGQQALVELRRKSYSLATILSPIEPLLKQHGNGYLAVGITQSRFERQVSAGDNLIQQLNEREKTLRPYLAAGLSGRLGWLEIFGAVEYEDGPSLGVGIRLPLPL